MRFELEYDGKVIAKYASNKKAIKGIDWRVKWLFKDINKFTIIQKHGKLQVK